VRVFGEPMIVARFALVLALAPHAQVADTGHRAPLPGMPPGRDSANIYAAIGAGMLDSVARRALPFSNSTTMLSPFERFLPPCALSSLLGQ